MKIIFTNEHPATSQLIARSNVSQSGKQIQPQWGCSALSDTPKAVSKLAARTAKNTKRYLCIGGLQGGLAFIDS
jgi:hypothetical protein